MINTWLLYLHKASLLALLCFVILGTISCSKALYYQDSFCIAPILRDEKVARLSADEQAVVRYLVHRLFEQTRQEADTTKKRYTYYIQVFGKNPDSSITAGLDDQRVKIKPASVGMLLCSTYSGLIYHPEVDWAELFSIDGIDIDGGTAKVELSYYWAPLSAWGYEYSLIRKGESWEYVRSKIKWVS